MTTIVVMEFYYSQGILIVMFRNFRIKECGYISKNKHNIDNFILLGHLLLYCQTRFLDIDYDYQRVI